MQGRVHGFDAWRSFGVELGHSTGWVKKRIHTAVATDFHMHARMLGFVFVVVMNHVSNVNVRATRPRAKSMGDPVCVFAGFY